jgi:DNA-binding transcriptional ArsR family regulator
MREVTIADAIAQVAGATGLKPADDLEPTEQLIALELRVYSELGHQLGLYPPSEPAMHEKERNQVLFAVQFLRGGPLHGRFWHWIDRFYYEAYRPWRAAHLDTIAALEQTAIDGLGGREGTGPPALDWLPPAHMLVSLPTARAAAEAGEFEIVFWAEPFGIESAAVGAPGMLMTSFAEHGIDREYSIAVRDDLAAKLKALADPTRLDILRMARFFDADNTQIAGFMSVSRPTVSVHAKTLAGAGFISTERQGRQARHSFHPEAVREFCEDLLRYLDVPSEGQNE